MACTPAECRAEGPGEYQTKAALICNFVRFSEWPARRFNSPEAPIVLGTFGADDISSYLREAIQGRRFKDRPVTIVHCATLMEVAKCHLLFVSRSERGNLGRVLGEARREGILTVGECDGFIKEGGVINFVLLNGRWKYDLNLSAAKRERLTLSGQLLQYALQPADKLALRSAPR